VVAVIVEPFQFNWRTLPRQGERNMIRKSLLAMCAIAAFTVLGASQADAGGCRYGGGGGYYGGGYGGGYGGSYHRTSYYGGGGYYAPRHSYYHGGYHRGPSHYHSGYRGGYGRGYGYGRGGVSVSFGF